MNRCKGRRGKLYKLEEARIATEGDDTFLETNILGYQFQGFKFKQTQKKRMGERISIVG